jgi:hypothetical protein
MKPRTIVPLVVREPVGPAMVTAEATAAVAPLAPVPHVTYHGGALIGSVEVVVIFWGPFWTQAGAAGGTQLQTDVNRFFDFVLTSSFMDTLREYSTASTVIGHGRRIASVNITTDPGTANPAGGRTVSDAQIQQELQNLLANGTVPAANGNRLYFFYLPPNCTVTFQGGASCQAFCGYHESINAQTFYAVEPFITCPGCSFGVILDSLTKVSSHELAEAITDPFNGGGWWDDNTGDEIGDICNTSTTRLGGFLVQNQWSNTRGTCALGGLTPYERFLLHTGTPLAVGEDSNGDFLVADFNGDGVQDLYFIKRRNTGTNKIEVHVLSGRGNYQQFLQHAGTALAQGEDGNGDFLLADFDRDGIPDLYFIKRRNTGTNFIEVHVLSGRSSYQQFTVHAGTALAQGEDLNGDFALADFDRDGIPDLYFIKRRNTGTKSIEIHVLTGKSNFQQFALHTGTPLAQGEDHNGDFLVADFDSDRIPDLYFIKRRNTGTNSIEVHVLSGRSQYQQFVQHTGTALAQGEDHNGSFQVADFDGDKVPDLFFIKRRNTGTNSIEMHILAERL